MQHQCVERRLHESPETDSDSCRLGLVPTRTRADSDSCRLGLVPTRTRAVASLATARVARLLCVAGQPLQPSPAGRIRCRIRLAGIAACALALRRAYANVLAWTRPCIGLTRACADLESRDRQCSDPTQSRGLSRSISLDPIAIMASL